MPTPDWKVVDRPYGPLAGPDHRGNANRRIKMKGPKRSRCDELLKKF